jgi:Glycosyl transferase family 11
MIITSRLSGGLGNQMMQYGVAKKISYTFAESQILIDLSYLNHGNSQVQHITHRDYALEGFRLSKKVKISNSPVSDGIVILNPDFDITFVSSILSDLLDDFELHPHVFTMETSSMGAVIQSYGDNSVAVHVRRGDYISNPNAFAFHEILTPEFFYKAINIVATKINNPVFFIFSDDIEYCRRSIKIQNYKSFYVGARFSGHLDLGHFQLMRLCKNFIISNSTYSWWPAFLSSSPLVVAPRKWFKNQYAVCKLLPKQWIAI